MPFTLFFAAHKPWRATQRTGDVRCRRRYWAVNGPHRYKDINRVASFKTTAWTAVPCGPYGIGIFGRGDRENVEKGGGVTQRHRDTEREKDLNRAGNVENAERREVPQSCPSCKSCPKRTSLCLCASVLNSLDPLVPNLQFYNSTRLDLSHAETQRTQRERG